MPSATLKLFLPKGDAKSLRTAEISNWTGKAIAAPRTELEELLKREELDKPGVYLLIGTDPDSNNPRAYVGEAEVIRERLKQHKGKEFWVTAIAFVSKDENLTKAHVRYLESRILADALEVGRFNLEQNLATGAKLPESDREDMEVFLERVRQLLPVLGTDILTPVSNPVRHAAPPMLLTCRVKDAIAQGHRNADGFVVIKGSTAVGQERAAAGQWVITLRQQLRTDGALIVDGSTFRFARDTEFASPSAAAAVVVGGNANGLTEWKAADGRTLKQLDQAD